jgi:hypothetical protein
MDTSYDVFLSRAWEDGDYPQKIGDALRGAGLSIWFDATEIHDFESITNAVNVDLPPFVDGGGMLSPRQKPGSIVASGETPEPRDKSIP